MRRIAVLTCALAGLLGGALAYASDGPAARVLACDVKGPQRSAEFQGRMDAVPGATRMAMRFVLVERFGKAGAWSKIDVPELREWRRSAAGVKTFAYRQTVANLRAGAAYKARIVYRWTGATGSVIQSATKETPVCRGPLPNLRIRGLAVREGPTADTRTYRVTIENDGKTAAEKVAVVLTVDDAVLDAAHIKRLDVGAGRTASFTGPPCDRGVRVGIDPDNLIGERLEADNSQVFPCP